MSCNIKTLTVNYVFLPNLDCQQLKRNPNLDCINRIYRIILDYGAKQNLRYPWHSMAIFTILFYFIFKNKEKINK